MVKVGIYGATGYMGAEALRILLQHPQVEVVWATSRDGEEALNYHKNFYKRGIQFTKPEEVSGKDCDVVFFSTPTGLAAEMGSKFLHEGSRIIDFGADFRLKDQATWEEVYGRKHPNWELAKQAVYGINELHKEAIVNTKVVANPGCFSSSAILALAPLIKENLIDCDKIIVDGMSGTAGAGVDLDFALHHPQMHNNILPYNVVNHRHSYEIEQELMGICNEKVNINFTSYYVPISRGILSACHCFPVEHVTRQSLLELYNEFYKDSYFIKVIDIPENKDCAWNYMLYPWVSSVVSTNFCHIGLSVDEKRNRIVVFSVLDSIGKGGAQVGVQNMNLIMGLDEREGLENYGLYPY